jgi:hypothetical protein
MAGSFTDTATKWWETADSPSFETSQSRASVAFDIVS